MLACSWSLKCVKGVVIRSSLQVCSLLWNPYDKEILSGLDGAENQLRLWKWPAMHHVSDLLDHSGRVLHLTLSPDGCTACR